MKITVSIIVPDGPTCYFSNGLLCPWQLKHTGSGQRWCRIFNDAMLSRSGEKCTDCLEVCKNAEAQK